LKKRGVARWVRELSLPLTINAVIHRQNIENLPAIIDYAVEVGAGRLEVAHTQYYAWALVNRAALIPTREQFLRSVEITNAAKERLKGILVFDVVAHDHYAVRPKPCMGGWGRNLLDITPSGKVLPCHACEATPGLEIDNIRDRPLAEIWFNGHPMDEGAVPFLRAARDRLGRLPLPGARHDRRCRGNGSGLLPVSVAPGVRRAGRAGVARAGTALRLPPDGGCNQATRHQFSAGTNYITSG
jgi:MoaA/NifB/PqqE/SkfB family radical SAM enzyme